MRPLPALCLILCVSACGDARLHDAEGELRFDPPEAIVFPSTPVGGSTVRSVRVLNSSRYSAHVRTSIADPFVVDAPEEELPGGASVVVRVRFQPSAIGAFESSLGFGDDENLIVRGEAREACSAGTCQQPTSDADTGECSTLPAADGASCTTACVDHGECISGQCAGATVDCSDNDACTDDACDAITGCIHTTTRCEAPTDPCLVALCDPVRGCGTAPALDGTSCGQSDCVTSSVCLQGRCVERPTPEGTQCGEPSPCQPLGACHHQACERPPPVPLSAAWTWRPAVYTKVVGTPIMDEHGSLYVRTWSPLSYDSVLYAVTRDGRQLYRRTDPFTGGKTALVDQGVLVGQIWRGIRAVEASTGRDSWHRDDLEALVGSASVVPDGIGVWSSKPGEVSTFVVQDGICDNCNLWRLSFDTRSGSVTARSAPVIGFGPLGAFSDESGNRYFSFASATREDGPLLWTVAEDASGRERWRVRGTALVRATPWNGRLVTSSRVEYNACPLRLPLGASSESAGTSTFSRPDLLVSGANSGMPSIRATGDAWFAVARIHQDPTVCPIGDRDAELVRFDPDSGSTLWSSPIARGDLMGELLPTDSDSLLFTDLGPDQGMVVLRNVGFDGREQWRCELPSSTTHLVGLHQGRAFFLHQQGGIVAIDLPGLDLAKHGWVTEFGDPEHRLRPR